LEVGRVEDRDLIHDQDVVEVATGMAAIWSIAIVAKSLQL